MQTASPWPNRRPLVAALCGATFLLVVGCVARDGAPKPSPEPTVDPNSPLLLWHTFQPGPAQTLHRIVDGWRAQNPTVRIEISAKPFDQALEAFRQAAAAGRAPDLFLAEISWTTALAADHLLAELDEFFDDDALSGILPQALTHAHWRGKLVGIPQQVDCLALLYNRRLLREAKVDVPDTMHDFAAAASNLSDPGTRRYGFYLPADGYWVQPFIWSFGGELLDPITGDPAIRSAMAVLGLQFVLDLRDKHGGFPEQQDFAHDYEAMMRGFGNETIAMIWNGPWAVPEILSATAFARPENLGIAALPRGPNGYGSPIGGHNWVVWRRSPHRARAAELIRLLTSPESQEQFAVEHGFLPTTTAACERPQVKSNRVVQEFLALLPKARSRPVSPIAARLYPQFSAACQDLFLHRETPESCAERIDRAWRNLMVQNSAAHAIP